MKHDTGKVKNERHFLRKKLHGFLLFGLLALAVLSCFFPRKVDAADKYKNTITTIKKNTWTQLKGFHSDWNYNTGDFTYYYHVKKFTVPANGYVKLQTNSSKIVFNISKSVRVDRDPERDSAGEYISDFYSGKKIYYFVLKKGTYYLFNGNDLDDPSGSGRNLKVRWSFVKSTNPTNYCKSRAKAVAAGKKQTICFNHGYEFSRWFKVTLKKKKRLTVNLKKLTVSYNSGPHFYIFNRNGEDVTWTSQDDNVYRTAVLPKGTYYIRIWFSYENMSSQYGEGRLCTFSWK